MQQAIAIQTNPNQKLVKQWMQKNFSKFYSYAMANLPIPHHHREDAISDMMVKMLHCPSFGEFLASGRDYSLRNILKFTQKAYRNTITKRGKDALGRARGCRTQNELRHGEVTLTLVSDQTAISQIDEDENLTYDFVDRGQPCIEDTLIAKDMMEHIQNGVRREWGEGSLPFETRWAVAHLMLLDEASRTDIEMALGVKSTRAKVIRSEVRDVAKHALGGYDSDIGVATRRVRRKRRNMTKSAKRIQRDLNRSLSSSDIPQWDRLGMLLPMVQYLATGEGDSPIAELQTRHQQYVFHALKMFGLCDTRRNLTDAGRAVAERFDGSRKSRNEIIRECIENTLIAQKWMRHCGVTGFHFVDGNTAMEFLLENSDVSESTAKRRARTLKRWVLFFKIGQ